MSNITLTPEEQQNISNTLPTTSRLRQIFFTVTPLSKIVAGVIMIVLPFVGCYIGYKYALDVQKQVVSFKPQSMSTYKENSPATTFKKIQQENEKIGINASSSYQDQVDNHDFLRYQFGEVADSFTGISFSTSTIRYVEAMSATDWDNLYETNYITLQDVQVNSAISSLTALPFLAKIIETPEALFFTAPSFSGKELSGAKGVFKLDLETRELVALKNSRFYNMPMAGSVRIPGTNKFLTAPEYPLVPEDKPNSELYVIDPILDSVSLISPITASDSERVSYCVFPMMRCEITFSVIDSNRIEVTKYISKSYKQGGGLRTEKEVLKY